MIPLAVPNLSGNEKKYLDNCIDTTFVSSVGEYVNKFEDMVAEATGSNFAVATSCGTNGLHVALTAVGVNANDLVIIPSFTFIATANAIHQCGAMPWMMEIEESKWCLNPDLLCSELKNSCVRSAKGLLIHKATGKRVAAIMPVYTLGNIPNMSLIKSVADEYGLPVVADAACAIGAEYANAPFGTLTDLSVLSFNGNKTVTCGGGGAVVGCCKELLDHVRHLTTTARVWPDYDFDEPGFNYRMTNIQAAVGVAQMEKMILFVRRKKYIRKHYEMGLALLKDKGFGLFPTTEGSSCWFSGIILPEGSNLNDTKKISLCLKEAGIDARPFWKPIHLQKPYANCPRTDMRYTDSLWQRILTLPCSTGISDDELIKVEKSLIDIIL